MMEFIRSLYFLHLYLHCAYSDFSQISQQAYFDITPDSVYIPYISSSCLINLTTNTILNRIQCAQTCLEYETCQTATYYEQTKTCSLYSEKHDIGQVSSSVGQASSVLTIMSRVPAICTPSSQSSWSQSAITIAGNSLGISGSDLSHFNTPIPIYYDQRNKLIIVGDKGNNRVMQFSLLNPSLNGTVIAGGNGYNCSLNQFKSIVGIAMDNSRQLFVADSGCNRIVKFPPNSNSSTLGVLISSLSLPQGIFINPLTNDLYVAMYSQASIIKFANYTTPGVIVAGGNSNGNNLNQIYHSNNVYFDYLYSNSLYVVDTGNHRILRFPANSSNQTYGIMVAGSNSSGNGSHQLNNPRAVVVDANGILYISDGNNNRIQRWLPNTTSGNTVVGGTTGTASNQLNSPESLFFDENYNLVVSDRGNHRIQLFNITLC